MAGDLRTLTQPLGRMIRWHEAPDPFASLRGDMEDLLGRYFRPVVSNGETNQMLVDVDVDETENAYVFTLDVPGVKREEIEIDFESGRLSISGERVRETKDETASNHRSQRSFGSFRTTFSLPGDVNGDKIDAKLKDGVLTVTVPKSDDAKKKAKKIAVKAA
jgi:HSP20 family protein